jgi:hypothetical protein
MARDMTNCSRCGHPPTASRRVCCTCLELNWTRASAAQGKATDLQAHSQLTRATARRMREDRQLRSFGATPLPSLNDGPHLLSLTSLSLELAPPPSMLETVPETERVPIDRLLSWPTSTTVYVWGCGRPQLSLTQYPIRSSGEARRVAAEQGWDEEEWAAWAAEFEVPQPLTVTLEQLGSQLWDDPAVQGWRLHRVD